MDLIFLVPDIASTTSLLSHSDDNCNASESDHDYACQLGV
jgi:hypothetical protein